MESPPFCPSCGHNLRAEQPTTDGPWTYDLAQGMTYRGVRLPCRPQVHQLLGAALQAGGRTLDKTMLADRLGYEGDRPQELIATLLSQGRAAVRRVGAVFPLQTVWAVGVRWNAAAAPSAAVRAAAERSPDSRAVDR